jgi:hypothetical protein
VKELRLPPGVLPKLPPVNKARFAHAIPALKHEVEHWSANRETDPEYADQVVNDCEDAIAQLKKLQPEREEHNPYARLEPLPDWLREAAANEPLVHRVIFLAVQRGWSRERFFEVLAKAAVEQSGKLRDLLVQEALRSKPV